MNIPEHQSFSDCRDDQQNYSETTVIAESINSIRRVTLLMYADSRLVVIYVLDPTKFRPNLVFKTLVALESILQINTRDRQMEFFDNSSATRINNSNCQYWFYAKAILKYTMCDLLPRVQSQ